MVQLMERASIRIWISILRIHIEIELVSVYLQPQHWEVGLGLIEISR